MILKLIIKYKYLFLLFIVGFIIGMLGLNLIYSFLMVLFIWLIILLINKMR